MESIGLRKTPAQSSAGSALLTVGIEVHCQWWGRDRGFAAPCIATLSAGLRYWVRP